MPHGAFIEQPSAISSSTAKASSTNAPFSTQTPRGVLPAAGERAEAACLARRDFRRVGRRGGRWRIGWPGRRTERYLPRPRRLIGDLGSPVQKELAIEEVEAAVGCVREHGDEPRRDASIPQAPYLRLQIGVELRYGDGAVSAHRRVRRGAGNGAQRVGTARQPVEDRGEEVRSVGRPERHLVAAAGGDEMRAAKKRREKWLPENEGAEPAGIAGVQEHEH